MAKDISETQLVVFIATLRAHAPSSTTDIVLFMNKLSPRASEIFTKFTATPIMFDENDLLPSSQPTSALMASFHPSTYRWPMIQEYFRQVSERSERALRKTRILAMDLIFEIFLDL